MGSAPRRSSGSERTRHSSDVYRVSKKSVVMGFLGVQCGISKLAGSQVGETADIVLGGANTQRYNAPTPAPQYPGPGGRRPSLAAVVSRARYCPPAPADASRCVEVRGGVRGTWSYREIYLPWLYSLH